MVPRTDSSLRVLQMAPRLPWPLDTGAKLRNFHLARVMSAQAQVSLLAFQNEPQHQELAEKFYERVTSVARGAHNSLSNVVRGAVGRMPLPLLNYTSAEMASQLERLLSAHKFDVVQFESIHLMNYLPIARVAKRAFAILDWHNIESELLEQYGRRETNPLRRAYVRRTAKLMKQAEARAAREFDAHIVVSEPDAERLRALNPDARIFVIENGVDVAQFAESRHSDSARDRIVFVASMDYHANIDAAVWFAREAWPQIHEAEPKLRLTIVGRDPAAAVRALASLPGVEVTGTVEDVRPFYREAVAAIAPLRVGGGSRLKILEAMAAGIPVVATTLGAEGLDVQPGETLLIGDSIESLCDAIVSMSRNNDRRAKLIEAGRMLVKERYDWSRMGRKLLESYRSLMSQANSV